VKIYETAQLTRYVLCFLNQKTKIHVSFANVLWVAFSIPLLLDVDHQTEGRLKHD
jgi:hypothetical protein